MATFRILADAAAHEWAGKFVERLMEEGHQVETRFSEYYPTGDAITHYLFTATKSVDAAFVALDEQSANEDWIVGELCGTRGLYSNVFILGRSEVERLSHSGLGHDIVIYADGSIPELRLP